MVGRLRSLGFKPLVHPPPYLFGEEPLMGDVCEEAELHAFDVSETALPELTMDEADQTGACLAFGLLMLYAIWRTSLLEPGQDDEKAIAGAKRD